VALRVLHIGKFYPPHRGGMEVFLADLIHAQRAAGIDAVALVHGQPEPSDPDWITRVPVQWQLVFAPIAVGFRSAIAKAITTHQPHVIHLHMPNNSALWVLTLRDAQSVPWVVHWHSDVVVSRIRSAVALAYRLYRPFEQAVLGRAARIIATSPPYLAASEPLSAWRDKCAVVPLGLDTAQLQYSDVPDISALTWQPGKLRLLSVGRLTYYKGFETLIRAVAPLEDVELLIVGDGELRGALEALVHALTPPGSAPNVRLAGNVDDAQKHMLLGSCDVFCLASRERTEAFGVAILEAMYHARPCIVSALQGSGMPWLIGVAGAGLQVPAEDVPAWTGAIRQMQRRPDLRAQWGASGEEALRTHFSMAACSNAIAREYKGAAPDASPPADPSKDVLIVIPARNEALTIGSLLQHLRSVGWHDILVINDQSTDDTASIARAAGARVLSPTLPVGAWGGMQAGIRYALQHGYQAVVTMDADGQHEVDELPVLLNARSQADLVVGAFPERASQLRQVAWNWFRQLAGFDLRDLTSGFRLYNRAVLEVLASREATLLDYQDLGALLLVRRAGLKIAEVPVTMNVRAIGKSRIFNSWVSVAKYMLATSLLCLARWSDHRRS
jgi:glycosyltransferase involved in cell wall biosynthesis